MVARLSEIGDLKVLNTDFTEIVFEKGRARAQLMPIINQRSKLVVDHTLGPSKDTEPASEAWYQAKKTLKKVGDFVQDVIIHHDPDGTYICHRWLQEIVIKSNARIFPATDRHRIQIVGAGKLANQFFSLDRFHYDLKLSSEVCIVCCVMKTSSSSINGLSSLQ